ncbi:MAG: acyltransferase [Verrucomicrobiota bacterium]
MTSDTFTRQNRISGLDSIRFFAALWVMFSHFGFLPFLAEFNRNNPVEFAVRGLLGNMFPGVPAVIVFFLVSGFCIHRPFRDGMINPDWRFLARRYIRIGVPLLAAVGIIRWFDPTSTAFDLHASSRSVVWSLVAEVIYYTIYPGVLWLRRRWGWRPVLSLSFFSALLVIGIIYPGASHPLQFGPWLSWVIGLPFWLLGCILAENSDKPLAGGVSARKIWIWRGSIWLAAVASSVLLYHAHIGYPWTMLLFSVAVYYWLKNEIAYRRDHPAWRFTEWLGLWSYSIYAMHLVLPDFLKRLGLQISDGPASWLAVIFLDLAGCYCFYILFEKPSHWLGRQIHYRRDRSNSNECLVQ